MLFCGYQLRRLDLRHIWCDVPYRGVDCRLGLDIISYRGTQFGRIMDRYAAATDMLGYIRTIASATILCRDFNGMGMQSDVVAIWVPDRENDAVDKIRALNSEAPPNDLFRSLDGFDLSRPIPSYHSMLFQPGLFDRLDATQQRLWSVKLNQCGLLSSVEEAHLIRTEFHMVAGMHEVVPIAVYSSAS